MPDLISWLALNQRVKLSDERRAQEQRRTDEKRRAEAEWLVAA